MSARAKRPAGRVIAPTYALAGVAFAGALGGLVAQVQAGTDPALGAAKPAAQLERPRYVVVHRVVRRKIVTRVVYDRPAAPTAVAAAGSGGGVVASRSSGSGAAAPAAAAPAPAASAAPAPAPAVSPPVTRAS